MLRHSFSSYPGFPDNKSGFRWHTHLFRTPLTPKPCGSRFLSLSSFLKTAGPNISRESWTNSPSEASWQRAHGKMIQLYSFLTTNFEVLMTHLENRHLTYCSFHLNHLNHFHVSYFSGSFCLLSFRTFCWDGCQSQASRVGSFWPSWKARTTWSPRTPWRKWFPRPDGTSWPPRH